MPPMIIASVEKNISVFHSFFEEKYKHGFLLFLIDKYGWNSFFYFEEKHGRISFVFFLERSMDGFHLLGEKAWRRIPRSAELSLFLFLRHRLLLPSTASDRRRLGIAN